MNEKKIVIFNILTTTGGLSYFVINLFTKGMGLSFTVLIPNQSLIMVLIITLIEISSDVKNPLVVNTSKVFYHFTFLSIYIQGDNKFLHT
jgi:hypothetical protein